VAVNGGDKSAIEAAFADLGKNGCGGCHTTFREKIAK
jgi:cytochrome c556